jgi:hypothetical protein
MKPARPVVRHGRLALGLVLMSTSPLASPLPGPGGLMMFAGGLSLTLRNSPKARRIFARQMKRYPRTGALLDRALRRESAKRRRARDGA